MGVYTELKYKEKKYIEEIYNLEIKKIEFINTGILNSNFLIYSDTQRYVLRIYEADRNLFEEEEELKLLETIADFIPVPQIIKSQRGLHIEEYGTLKFTLFSFIQGETLDKIDQGVLREIAWYLGKFHRYSEERVRNYNRKSRIDLDFYMSEIEKSKIDFNEKEKIFSIYEELKNIDFNTLPKGIIHADIFPDNVIVKDGHINGIIDFNESYYGPYVYDLAIVINFWIKIKEYSFQKEYDLIRDFLNNYSRHRKIKKEEIKLLNLACRKMALTFIALRLYKEKIEKAYEKALDIEEKSYLSLIKLIE